MLVRHVMSKSVVSIQLPATISDATALMLNKKISSLPILQDDKPAGMVTTRDILGLFNRLDRVKFLDPSTDVSEIMTSPVVMINQNEQLKKALDLMREKNFHHLLVVDNNGNMTGILSSLDIARAYGKDETTDDQLKDY